MSWYDCEQKNPDGMVISSRVRLARNLSHYPFPIRLDEKRALALIGEVEKILVPMGFQKIDFTGLSDLEAAAYVEKRYVSPEFAKKEGPHALFLNEPCNLSVMVNEEDHLRIQCIEPSLSLNEVFRNAADLEERLDEALEFAYDESLGYLTQCPTNLGTGMRASVMLFLPALTLNGYMEQVGRELTKVGLTVRGMYGEGSQSQGCIYQVSNQICMGLTEEEILKKLDDAVAQIRDLEKQACDQIRPGRKEQLKDAALRAVGLLRSAWLMSSAEFFKLYADVHFGIDLGFIRDISLQKLNSLLVGAMPAMVTLNAGPEVKDETSRDRERARLLRETLAVQ